MLNSCQKSLGMVEILFNRRTYIYSQDNKKVTNYICSIVNIILFLNKRYFALHIVTIVITYNMSLITYY